MSWGHPRFSLLGGDFLQLAVKTYCSRTLYIVSISYRVYLVLFILVEVFSSGAQEAQGSSLGDSQPSGSIILSCFAPGCTGDVRGWKHSVGSTSLGQSHARPYTLSYLCGLNGLLWNVFEDLWL